MNLILVKAAAIAPWIDRIVASLEDRGANVRVTDLEGLKGLASDAVDILAGPGSMPCDQAFFARHGKLRAVVAIGSGTEGIDRTAASDAGVLIGFGATRENVEGMAAATLMLMLALLHDLKGHEATLRAGGAPVLGRSLHGLTAGLIGYGAIGREVAQLLRPWRVRILVASPRIEPGSGRDGVEGTTLDDLLTQCDIVSLHAGLNAGTRGLLDARRLGRMKRGAILINVARGGMVDEAAAAQMLREGRLGGAAFDVFETEPLPPESPLRNAPNTLLTPHRIGHTHLGMRSIVDALVANVAAVMEGRPPPLLRNPEAVEMWRARSSMQAGVRQSLGTTQ